MIGDIVSTYKGKPCKRGHNVRYKSSRACVACMKTSTKKWLVENRKQKCKLNTTWRQKNPQKAVWMQAKNRATRKGIKFTLKIEDIKIPIRCPILGIKLKLNTGRAGDDSVSIDRINNDLGYVPSNIMIISQKVNQIKNNASLAELKIITRFYSNLEKQNGKANTRRRPKPVLPVLTKAMLEGLSDVSTLDLLARRKPKHRRANRSVVLQPSLASDAIN